MLCQTCTALVDDVHAASSRYFEAATALMQAACDNAVGSFVDAKYACDLLHEDCRVARQDLVEHKALHAGVGPRGPLIQTWVL